MWGGWGGLAQGLRGSPQDRRKEQSKDPAPGNKGPNTGMMRGAERRAYRIFLLVAVLVAALVVRACSVTVESGIEGHYQEPEPEVHATPTPESAR